MSAPKGAGRSVEIRIVGYVTLQDVCSHVGDIWRAARQQKGVLFAVDCSAVIDFSTLALTAMGRLRKHLREFGCDLVLAKCSPSVLERKDDPLVAPLLIAELAVPETAEYEGVAEAKPVNRVFRAEAPAPARRDQRHEVPAPHHIRILAAEGQRYWLN